MERETHRPSASDSLPVCRLLFGAVSLALAQSIVERAAQPKPPRRADAPMPPRRARRQGWTADGVMDAVVRWTETYGRPPKAHEWNPTLARTRGLADAETVERRFRSGEWPSDQTARRLFGSWANAVEAAGYDRPRQGVRGFRSSSR